MKPSNIIIASNETSLSTYQDCFRSENPRWNVQFHSEPEDVKATIEEEEVAVVILDRNFGDNALDIVDEIKAKQPSTQIYLVIRESEREHLELSLGGQVAFLPKPFTSSVIIESIRKSLAIESWLGQEKVKKLISGNEEFSSLPHMYLKIMGALNSRDASVEQIGQLISEDLAITTKLLQVVNSSFFSFDEEVSDITHAVTVLGIDHVKSLVLAIQVFRRSDNSGTQATIDRLLHHSMAVANAAKRITKYETEDPKREAEAYTAGLLHDIGKLVLLSSKPEETQEAWTLAQTEKISKSEAETRILGANHSEVGAYILGRWGMPISIVEAAAFHHEPNHGLSASSFSTLASVYIANTMIGQNKKDTDNESLFDSEFMSHQGLPNDPKHWMDIIDGKLTVEKKAKPSLRKAPEEEPERATKSRKPQVSPTQSGPAPSVVQPKNKSNKGALIALVGIAACTSAVAWLTLGGLSNNQKTVEPTPISWDNDEKMLSQTDVFDEKPSIETPQETIADSTTSDLKDKNNTAPTSPTKPVIAKDEEPVSKPVEKEVEAKKPIVATAVKAVKDLISPIKEKVQPSDPFPNVQLSGIFYNASNPAANINGKIVRVGNTISGVKILSITRNSVQLQYNNQQRSVKLD